MTILLITVKLFSRKCEAFYGNLEEDCFNIKICVSSEITLLNIKHNFSLGNETVKWKWILSF